MLTETVSDTARSVQIFHALSDETRLRIIEPTRVYRSEDAAAFLIGNGLDAETFAREIDGKFFSGFVRPTKPSGRSFLT